MHRDPNEGDKWRFQERQASPIMQHDAIRQHALLRHRNIGRSFYSNPKNSGVTLRP